MQLLFHLFLNVASLLYRRTCFYFFVGYAPPYIVGCLSTYFVGYASTYHRGHLLIYIVGCVPTYYRIYLLTYIVEYVLGYLGESFPKHDLPISVSAFKCRIIIFYV